MNFNKWTMTLISLCICVGCNSYNARIPGKKMSIWDAIEREDTDAISAYADAGGDLDVGCTIRGTTPLFYAMELDKKVAFQKLLECGANPETTCLRGMRKKCVLHWAAQMDSSFWLEEILSSGADPNYILRRDDIIDTPMAFAIGRGHGPLPGAIECVKTLAKHNVDLDMVITSPPQFTALDYSVTTGHYDIALVLLELGADPNSAEFLRVVGHHFRTITTVPPTAWTKRVSLVDLSTSFT